MQSITIQASKSVLDEIMEFIKDKNVKFSIKNDDLQNFDDIKAKIKDTIKQIQKGTIEFYSHDEIK